MRLRPRDIDRPKFKKIVRSWGFWTTSLLVLSFAFNALAATSVYNFNGFQADSEQLVRNALECQQKLGYGSFSGQLLIKTGKDCDKTALPYYPQSGLPFWLMGRLYPSGHTAQRAYMQGVKITLAILSALMLAAICRRITVGLRIRYQALVYMLLALSPWLVVFSVNLFWLLPLLLAPAWFGWVFYERLRGNMRKFYVVLGALFFLKFLAGYEYSTTLTISAICPVLWYELRNKMRWRQLLNRSALVVVVAVSGFILALGINFWQAAHQTRSAKTGFHVIYDRARMRTLSGAAPDLGPGIVNQLALLKPHDYEFFENTLHLTDHTTNSKGDRIWQNAIVLYQYMATPTFTSPIEFRFPFTVLLTSVGAFALFTCVVTYKRFKRFGLAFAYTDPLVAVTFVALMGGLSWLVFGYQHSFIHTHINPIIFYLPFLPLSYVLLAHKLQDALSRHPRKRKLR